MRKVNFGKNNEGTAGEPFLCLSTIGQMEMVAIRMVGFMSFFLRRFR